MYRTAKMRQEDEPPGFPGGVPRPDKPGASLLTLIVF